MAQGITREDLLQLVIVVLIGWGISQILQRMAPIGRDVGTDRTAQVLLLDKVSPSQTVKAPTLTLVVFTDYQCPACKLADPAMAAAVANDGHVRVVYKDWPIFGPRSEQAARIAIAADRQGIYPALHRRLMDERRPLDEPVLREAVALSGGNWSRIQQDLRVHGVQIERQLYRNGSDAFALGIAGTPAYLSGSLLVTGALDEAGFAKAFKLGRDTAK